MRTVLKGLVWVTIALVALLLLNEIIMCSEQIIALFTTLYHRY